MNFARATGRWGIDDTVTTTPAADLDLSDVSALDRTVAELAMEDLGWRVLLTRNGISAVSVSYEHICQNPFGFVATLAHKLGIDRLVAPRLQRAPGVDPNQSSASP